jgi:hypothetical protein
MIQHDSNPAGWPTLFPEEGSKLLLLQPREGQDVFNLTYVCDCDALWWCVGLMPLDKDLSRAKGR